ncbi:hypothetical protein Gotri_025139 [Gossypium trilobum]|uniref:Transposase MuDR plant domain-containing protein n=1 Tax=Gossypium trilobum TaxID=34281 RepID=A0A7J9FMU6_9ROSI|nr:hypothetical protein [Gossypium trilobum]
MLDFWVKFKEIELYVEHEVDNPIIIDEIFLLTTGEGDVEGVEVYGEGDDEEVESDGEGDLEKVESGGDGEVREVQADGEGMSATSIEVDEDINMEIGGYICLGSTVGEDNDSEVVADEYAGDFTTLDRVDNIADERMGMRPKYGTQMNMEAWLGPMKMKNMKMRKRQLKFIKNEPKRVVVRCIASPDCPWRIRASYSPVAKYLQIKTFQD